MNNMKEFLKKNIKIIKIALLLLLIVITARLTYSFFYFEKSTDNELVYDGYGKIDMDLNELSSGVIVDNQVPMSDDEGMAQVTSYSFSVSGYSEIVSKPLYYEIFAIPGNAASGKTLFDDLAIKLYLTDDEDNAIYGPNCAYDFNTKGTSLIADEFSGGTESNPIVHNYVLRVWISDNVVISNQEQEDKVIYTQEDYENRYISIKIKVQGSITKTLSKNIVSLVNSELTNNLYSPEGDNDQTFIVGTVNDTNYNPNNYLWYSGKLWRIVALNKTDGVVTSVKIITQNNIANVKRNGTTADGGNGALATYLDSYMYQWLNEDFYDTLKNPIDYLVNDYNWNATETTSTAKPPNTTLVTAPVGTLNLYEYTISYTNTTTANGYLKISYYWQLISPYDSSNVYYISYSGTHSYASHSTGYNGVRPAINLKPSVNVIEGTGTVSDPYRVAGDNDQASDLINVSLNARYSGEYVRFNNENYRIIGVENEATKLVKETSLAVQKMFGTTNLYSQSLLDGTSYWGGYLNDENSGWYSTLSNDDKNMIDIGTWYLGTYSNTSYKLSICAAVNTLANGGTLTKTCEKTSIKAVAKVGLPRVGEMFSGKLDGTTSCLITPYSTSNVFYNPYGGYLANIAPSNSFYARPTFYLKSTVKITGGDGTPNDPFTISI